MTDTRLILPGHAQPKRPPNESMAAQLIAATRAHRQVAEQYNDLLARAKGILECNKRLYSERVLMVAKLAELGHVWVDPEQPEPVAEEPAPASEPVEFFSDTPAHLDNEGRLALDQEVVGMQGLRPDQLARLKVDDLGEVESEGKLYKRSRFSVAQ